MVKQTKNSIHTENKLNFNDFLEILVNSDVRKIFKDIFTDSIQVEVRKCLDKTMHNVERLVNNLTAKIDELNASVANLRMQIQIKDAAIANILHENTQLKAVITNMKIINDELQQQ